MYRRILVPLDGSRLSERALPYAAYLSKATGAPLVLVRVVGPSGLLGVDEPAPVARSMQEAEGNLAEIARGLAAQDVTADVAVQYGLPADGILREIERQRADLVVMSTHGRSGLGRWIFGSVADELLRRIDRPVLLVPATSELAWRPGQAFRVLVPLDRSDLAAEALGAARELADVLKAEMLLLHVIEPPEVGAVEAYTYLREQERDTLPDDARQYLEGVAKGLRDGTRTVGTLVAFGPTAGTIARVAREEGISLVAMATHGRGGLSRLVMGSVAMATVQWTSVPILIVRPVARQAVATEPETASLGAEP